MRDQAAASTYVRMWLKPRSAVRGCQPLREGGFGPTRDDARGGHAEFFRASPAGEPPFSAENPRETDPRRAASPVGPSSRPLQSWWTDPVDTPTSLHLAEGGRRAWNNNAPGRAAGRVAES